MSGGLSRRERPSRDGNRAARLERKPIFPGTKRDIVIHVPAQIGDDDPGVVVFNDGNFYHDPRGAVRADAVLDTLHHRDQIPPTVGVFVLPGRPLDVLSAREEAQAVSADLPMAALDQRSDEYDRLTDAYPRFLVEELLPLVEGKLGRKLSADPKRRVVCGISSGGIAAFNAAWHRPESFGGVISHCGSYVNIQGGHNYPTLVRLTERKPIRVWMQSGANDAEAVWGSLPLANQQMAAALEFAGYDVHFEFGTGGHSTRHGGAMLAETLRWMWPSHGEE